MPPPLPKFDEKPKDLLSQMLQIGHDQKLPQMPKVISEIDRVEQRANIKVNDYLGFGKEANKQLKYHYKAEHKCHLIGE